MKIVKEKTVSYKTKITIDIICNKCGKSCSAGQPFIDKFNVKRSQFFGLIDGEVTGGYDSPVLSDCTKYKFSICEHCLKDLFDSFKIPVEEEETSAFGF